MSEDLKIDPYGFREYDARWVYKKDINLLGVTNLGKGLGTQIIKHTKKVAVAISVVGRPKDISAVYQRRASPTPCAHSRMTSCAWC